MGGALVLAIGELVGAAGDKDVSVIALLERAHRCSQFAVEHRVAWSHSGSLWVLDAMYFGIAFIFSMKAPVPSVVPMRWQTPRR
ncbi:MAG: hypothetical protein JOZ73_09935 [Solirubrobacterales bacterium]|nr:hypothetical protein [Solirubrobacterales bacterium]